MYRVCHQPEEPVLGLCGWQGGKLSLSELQYTHLSNGAECQVRLDVGEAAEAPSLPGAGEGPGWDLEARLEPPDWFIVRQGPQLRSRPGPGVAL